MQITINTPDEKPSWLKRSPRQSSELAGSAEIAANPSSTLEKILVEHGQILHVKDAHIDRENHIRLVFDKPAEFKLKGKVYSWPDAYLYSKHCKGYSAVVAQKVVAASPFSAAGSSKLIVPCTYRSQVDNSADTGQGPGWRQCASTSAVMLLETAKGLKWLKKAATGFAQPEDWYTTQLTEKGFDTTDPQAHVSMLNGLGVPVTFRYDCSISDMNKTLDKGLLLMAGVNWKSGGHYVGFAGRDLVTGDYFWKDPYGLRAFDGDDPIDEYVTIGSGGDLVRLSMKKVQNVWLDLGDRAGWSLYPGDEVYGVNYQKPVIEIVQANASVPIIESITCNTDTILKTECRPSTQLQSAQKMPVKKGYAVAKAVRGESGHILFQLADGRSLWGYGKHWDTPTAISNAFGGKGVIGLDKAKLQAAVEKYSADGVKVPECTEFVEAFWKYAAEWSIVNRVAAIHFLAQAWVESGSLRYTKELGDDDYFAQYNCTDGYMENGPTDGPRYPGRGLIQCTWRKNYRLYGEAVGIDAVNNPELLERYPDALRSALWFWKSNNLSDIASRGLNEDTVTELTHRINGGENHLADRIEWMYVFSKAI